jgi:RNA polymerase sigma-70 factor (ECF subfamily)
MTDSEFREAYRQHKDVLYRFAWRMTGSAAAAEDLVQDCFLLFWRNAALFHHERGTLRSFLIGVTRNLALKRLRKERPFDELEEESAVCGQIDPAVRERGQMVEQAVAALPPLQRETLILAEYEELSLEEIASATGAELAAVKSRLHRARQNLKHLLAPLLKERGTIRGTHG